MAAPSAGSKRRSSSARRSEYARQLAGQGIHLRTSNMVSDESKALCDHYLDTTRPYPTHSSFPLEKLPDVLQRVHILNEARIQRDITPWLVPSVETLRFCGEPNLDDFGEELEASWIKCAPMRGHLPKPDYVAGVISEAFTEEEMDALLNYTTLEKPIFCTPNLCFPFLVCEVKTSESSNEEAEQQNIHSASIAVRAIIELHKAAFGETDPKVTDLYGKVLVFSISHDPSTVTIYGHYACPVNGNLEFYRHGVTAYNFTMEEDYNHKVYSFVRNLYDDFAPEHLSRIKAAAAMLPAPPERTGLSFAASNMNLQSDSQEDSGSQAEQVFAEPTLPASALQLIEKQRLDMERQMREQRKEMAKQMEEQMGTQRRELEEQKKQIADLMRRLG